MSDKGGNPFQTPASALSPSRERASGLYQRRIWSKRVAWVLALAGTVAMVSAVLGWSWFQDISVFNAEIRRNLEAHPEIAKRIGTIRTFDVDWLAAAETPSNVVTYDIEGDRGAGEVLVELEVVEDRASVLSVTLLMRSGERYHLYSFR